MMLYRGGQNPRRGFPRARPAFSPREKIAVGAREVSPVAAVCDEGDTQAAPAACKTGFKLIIFYAAAQGPKSFGCGFQGRFTPPTRADSLRRTEEFQGKPSSSTFSASAFLVLGKGPSTPARADQLLCSVLVGSVLVLRDSQRFFFTLKCRTVFSACHGQFRDADILEPLAVFCGGRSKKFPRRRNSSTEEKAPVCFRGFRSRMIVFVVQVRGREENLRRINASAAKPGKS